MNQMVDLSPEFFKKMNHRYEIALYIDNNYYVKHYFTFYKPLKKNNTNILPKQVIGKQKVLLNWEEMIGAVSIMYIVQQSMMECILIWELAQKHK